MKKVIIWYKHFNVQARKYEQITLRAVTVQPSFTGIGRKGEIHKKDFDDLAQFLEPTSDGCTVIDA